MIIEISGYPNAEVSVVQQRNAIILTMKKDQLGEMALVLDVNEARKLGTYLSWLAQEIELGEEETAS